MQGQQYFSGSGDLLQGAKNIFQPRPVVRIFLTMNSAEHIPFFSKSPGIKRECFEGPVTQKQRHIIHDISDIKHASMYSLVGKIFNSGFRRTEKQIR